ncbi:DnaB-like helicase C-terminal domain-containing protein [Hyphomonas sp.]|uniref:DnaB-like helicase C-terminal domain-containing protein n=1 Tax=Hyphomonas sp. TaxID=87 RepID=UPI0025C397F5|nr:DnaB-like helicase C-terminal domain-containing protein [Hyphomonas sp.]
MKNIELVILQNLIYNDEFSRKVTPFLKKEYFHDQVEQLVFSAIQNFISTYNALPTKEAIVIDLDKKNNLTEPQFQELGKLINSLTDEDTPEMEWLSNQTEEFCKDKAVYNAIMESIHILEDKSESKTANAIPEILSDALAVSFDTHIGHDYIEDAEERYEFYHRVEKKVPFDLEYFNTITAGGTPQKTLNIIMAGTGVGKSLFLCHHAANCLTQNQNVLYITCEMAEERIAERIDANLFDMTIDDVQDLPRQLYHKKLDNLKTKLKGKLIVKEYPTATANVNHFRALLDELWMKKQFKPDIIFIDYLNICASARLKNGANVNSYTYIKAIAEELRGMAVERSVPVFSATQVNRGGFNNTDVGLEDTSESFGLPATADFMIALISTEELEEQNQIMVKQLKNRYNDVASNKKFIVGINRGKMKLYDVEKNEQSGLLQTNQTEETKAGNGFDGRNFDDKFSSKRKFESWSI